jgi:hypothetical protein
LKKNVFLKFFLGLILSLFFLENACTADITYQGKVIDADTLQPIEEAVVAAVWNEDRSHIAGYIVRFKEAKEILTDKNGDWSIKGPEGADGYLDPFISFLFGKYYRRNPFFIIYKPGYWGTRTSPPPGRFGFGAYAYVDKKHGLEGIVLLRPGETWDEVREFSKKYPVGSVPFIPAKDPETKLRNLDFSFEYPENVRSVGENTKIELRAYGVIGLRRTKSNQERLDAMGIDFGEIEKLPILDKMLREERIRLLGPARREVQ